MFEPDDDARALRVRLLSEEMGELETAMEGGEGRPHPDIVGVADALADVAYIACGTLIAYGESPGDWAWLPSPLPPCGGVPRVPPRQALHLPLRAPAGRVRRVSPRGGDPEAQREGRRSAARSAVAGVAMSAVFGIPLQSVFSNMRKLGPDGAPIRRADGKVLKTPGWRGPDVAGVLRAAGWTG